MILNEKIRPYIFGFLLFCVFTSKNIIIYNEETLVALSFFGFIFFVANYFGNTLKQSLDEKSEGIKYELQNLLSLRALSLKQLYKEHQRVTALTTTLSAVKQFAVDQLKQKKTSPLEGRGSLKRVFSDQIKQRLNTLSSSKGDLYQQLQQIIGANIQKAVLVKISRVKQNPSHNLLNSKRVKQSVHGLIGKEEGSLNR